MQNEYSVEITASERTQEFLVKGSSLYDAALSAEVELDVIFPVGIQDRETYVGRIREMPDGLRHDLRNLIDIANKREKSLDSIVK